MGPLGWTLDEVALATAGVVVGSGAVSVTGVSTDSRTIVAGELFVAIAGEHFDGHDYVAAALDRGAAGVVVASGHQAVEPRVEVADTLRALRDLAVMRRNQLTMPFVAVTGSSGKTTTKDLLAAALPGAWASPRSYNNEVGVPLTVLGTPADARHAVVEVGSRQKHDIASLMPAVRPDVAIITNLGTVHLETFGSTENLAAAKFELVEALGARGVAVLPADEPRLLNRTHPGSTVTFGVDVDATVVARDVVLDETGRPRFSLETPDGTARVSLPVAGAVQAANAAASVAAGLALGIDLDVLLAGLGRAEASAWRMEIHTGRYTVVNDAYNANPQSVEAALRTVGAMPGRHLAVLGEMAELGPISADEHRRIGLLARDLGFVRVFVVGDAAGIAAGAGEIARRVVDREAAVEAALAELAAGDVVLVKGSRSVGLEAVAGPLIAASGGGHE